MVDLEIIEESVQECVHCGGERLGFYGEVFNDAGLVCTFFSFRYRHVDGKQETHLEVVIDQGSRGGKATFGVKITRSPDNDLEWLLETPMTSPTKPSIYGQVIDAAVADEHFLYARFASICSFLNDKLPQMLPAPSQIQG